MSLRCLRGFPHLRQDTRTSWLSGLRVLRQGRLGQVTRPVVHQGTPAVEQVGARIGRLHPVPDHMSWGRPNQLPGMVRPLPPSPGRPSGTVRHGRGMIDDFRLWGSRRCRRMGETASTWRCSPSRFMISTPTTPFSQRAESSPLWSETFTKRRIRRGTIRISRIRCDKAKRGCALRVPLGRLSSRWISRCVESHSASQRRPGHLCAIGEASGSDESMTTNCGSETGQSGYFRLGSRTVPRMPGCEVARCHRE